MDWMKDEPNLSESAVPRLPRGVRVEFDKVRDRWLLLAPERMLKLDQIAVEILKCVDGETAVKAIIDDLSHRFNTDRDRVSRDVRVFLGQIAAKRMLEI